MPDDRCVQPRQIYASTVTRRQRRWRRRRSQAIRTAMLLTLCALMAALSVAAAVVPVLV